jgi:serine/threonine protein kinase
VALELLPSTKWIAQETRAVTLEPGQIIATRYRLVSRLGEGGMAEVWRATHTGTERVVALKLIKKELVTDPLVREMFVREASIAARIGKNEHIVDVLDAGIDDALGVPYISMDLLEGEPLDVRLRREGALDRKLANELFTDFADALDQAHGAGVIHRDLKPQNLFLSRDRKGRLSLKILDFGIAKLSETAQQSSTTVGTPAYSAPEQLGPSWRSIAERQGRTIRSTVSPQTDVWAMGLVIYEALVGATSGELWGATTLAELPVKIVLEPMPQPTSGPRAALLPSGFDAWLGRCLDLDAEKRFASAGEAMRALSPMLTAEAQNPPAPVHPAVSPLPHAAATPTAPPVASHGAYPHASPPGTHLTPMANTTPQHVAPSAASSPNAHRANTAPPGWSASWPNAPNVQASSAPWSASPIAAWASARGLELRQPDMRAYHVWHPFEFLPRIGQVFREARFTLRDAQVLLAEASAADDLKRAIGEDRSVIAFVNSPIITQRVAIRSKQSAGIADGVSRGINLLSSLVEVDKRKVTIGDPRFEVSFEIAAPSPMEANAALPIALRKLFVDGNFRGIFESRAGGFAVSFFELKRFEPTDLDRIIDAVTRIYASLGAVF